MTKLQLPRVQLFALASNDDLEEILHAIRVSMHYCAFGEVTLLTPYSTEFPHQKIDKLSREGYNKFMIKELYEYVVKPYVLCIQADGYVLNPAAWTDVFYDYDFIGALWRDGKGCNGGFSLRSRELCDAVASIQLKQYWPEDRRIYGHQRHFESVHGLRFASHAIARRFSVEAYPWRGEFGFHGANGLTPINNWLAPVKLNHHTEYRYGGKKAY